jgi:hypothetical protein
MLVITIRKVSELLFDKMCNVLITRQDLDNDKIPKVVPVLDVLIQSPSAEVIPAV